MFTLTTTPINREELLQVLGNEKAGALVAFEGWVRNQNEGKAVSSLEYQVYAELAQKEGEKILSEAAVKFNLHRVLCTHRFGHLSLGDTAVWIGAIATHRDDAFKATRFVIDEIKHRLPIWKKEHYLTEEPKWVFCKHHHTHVHYTAEDYYQKQKLLTKQELLSGSRVLVIGAGGLGCPVLTGLTTAGVGHIGVVDFDRVSISNIHRQPLYSPEVVGEKKVIIAKNRLSVLNPFIHIHAHDQRVGAENIEKLFLGHDLILDCTDNLETKYLIHDACFKLKLPLISASIYQFEGQIRTFDPGAHSGCLRCLKDQAPIDSKLGNCNDFGVLGSAVAVLGSLQATEAITYLQEKTNATVTETFYFNVKTLSQMKIRNRKKADCLCCEGVVSLKTSDLEVTVRDLEGMDAVLFDLREKEDSCLEELKNEHKSVVLFCHRGIRSRELARKLRAEGFDHFYSLAGGACSL